MSKDHGRRRPPPTRGAPPPRREDGLIELYGTHAVEAALANPARRVARLRVTENAAHRLAEAIGRRGLTPEPVTPRELDRLLGPDTVHQGALALVEPLPEPSLEAVLETVATGVPLIVLDHVTDPHNVGAVLRSAAVFGAAGLLMTRRHSPPLNGTLAKSASGALELVPVLLVQNLAKTLADLTTRGVATIGLDSSGEGLLEDCPLTGPLALVLGAEGKGLRQLTKDSCGVLARIGAGEGGLKSLNVSNAAAVALHLAAMRRRAIGPRG